MESWIRLAAGCIGEDGNDRSRGVSVVPFLVELSNMAVSECFHFWIYMEERGVLIYGCGALCRRESECLGSRIAGKLRVGSWITV